MDDIEVGMIGEGDERRFRISYTGPPAEPFYVDDAMIRLLTTESRRQRFWRWLRRRPKIEVQEWTRL